MAQPTRGQLLALFVHGGQDAFSDVGTLGAYSSNLDGARALPPDGKLITLEADPSHADVASEYWRG